jgi:hypothetical protein
MAMPVLHLNLVLGMHVTSPLTHQISLWQWLRKDVTVTFVYIEILWQVAGTTSSLFSGYWETI